MEKLGKLDGVVLLRPHVLGSGLSGDHDFLEVGGNKLGHEIEDLFGKPLRAILRTYVHQRYYEWGQIDVLPALEWNGWTYADAEVVIAGASIAEDGFKRPRLGHDGLISWLTSLLWGGFYKEKYDGVITRAAREDRECFREGLSWALGEGWADQMLAWAEDGEAGRSAGFAWEIRRALMGQNLRRSGGDAISKVAGHWWVELKHHLSPKLPVIAFLGPDGSGHSIL